MKVRQLNRNSIKEDVSGRTNDVFKTLVLVHITGLHRFAISLCRNDFDADDLVAETLLKAFENFNRLKDRSKVKQWLFRILNNHFISNCRLKKKYIDSNFSIDENNNNETSFSLFESLAKSNFTDNGNPEKNFINKLTRTNIEDAISNLPLEFRQTLMLCDIENFSYGEIAAITAVPVGTVRSRIARARSILQKKLWLHAQELGIRKSKIKKLDVAHVCTCGKE